ncbi:MAG: response regulator [Deltaproteobacteria bacterium]|nr:response regulator [Deltaproteobacteria bacterium]
MHVDRPLRILVAEDNIHNEELYRLFLARTDIEAEYAKNGLLAVEAFGRGGFDLVVLDMQMPVLDGMAAARRMRAMERETGRGRTPLILLSAQDVKTLRQEDAELFEAILSKPIGRSEFLGAIVAQAKGAACPYPDRDRGQATDEAIRSMAPGFLEALADRALDMRMLAERGQHGELARLAHMIAGSAGSYGFPAIAALARAVESLAVERSPEAIKKVLALVELVESEREKLPDRDKEKANAG